MAGLFKVEAVLPFRTGVSRDVAINSFHFWIPASDPEPAINRLLAQVQNFYSLSATADPLSDFLTNFIDRSSCRKDLSFIENWETGSPVQSPLSTSTLTIPSSIGGDAMPLECAIVASLRGVPLVAPPDATFPPLRRRRGRLYLGPWTLEALVDDTLGRPLVNPDVIESARSACLSLATDADDSLGDADEYRWVVWSRVGRVLTSIVEGYVNNEFDTQRRREVDATTVSPWTVT